MIKDFKVSNPYEIKELSIESTKHQCRICLDTEKDNKNLIHPCRCAGSVKYVHEECLKSWLLSRDEDLISKSCELCHTNFIFEYQKINSSMPFAKIQEKSGLFVVVIFFILYELGLYEIYMPYLSSGDNFHLLKTIIALHLCCMASGGVYYFVDALNFYKDCNLFNKKVWHVKNQDFRSEIPEQEKEKINYDGNQTENQ